MALEGRARAPSDSANDASGRSVREPEAGPDVTAVSGGAVSTVHVRRAGEASTLPSASRARTSNACAPSASAGIGQGRRARREGGAVEAALERRAGLAREGERRARDGDDRALGRPAGERRVRRRPVDGEAARGRRGVDVAGLVAGAHVDAVCAVRKSAQRVRGAAAVPTPRRPAGTRRTTPPRRAEASSVTSRADGREPSAGPAVIVVSGAAVSTVQVRVSGAVSVGPAQRARTVKVCWPSARPR